MNRRGRAQGTRTARIVGGRFSQSVCSVCAPFVFCRKHKVKTRYSQSPERGAGNAMFFVSNLLSSSQAGRHLDSVSLAWRGGKTDALAREKRLQA